MTSPIISFQDVNVHIEGDGAETIVMVHGWPDTYRVWDGQVEHLKGRYRCVRFTLPGFAAADVRRTYSLDELTGLIKQIVEHVAPGQKVILMLHDWGCIFGYEFYMRNPHLVSKIVGVDVGDKTSVTQSRSLVDWVMVLSYQGWLAMAWIIGGPIGDWIARAIARAGGCPVPREHIGSRMTYPYFMEWFGGRQSYRRQGQQFIPACPILFLYGRRKPFMFHAKAWAEGLLASKGNRVEEFDTGHWVMLGQPERFNEVVDDWLRGLCVPNAGGATCTGWRT